MGMPGEPAIEPLADFLNDPRHREFAKVIALDSLAEIARHQPDCRERIIQCYRDYMSTPDESAVTLNGLLIGRLLDLRAAEAIDGIRQLFARDCVDITCAGDLEDVEIELGLRQTSITPRPDYTKLCGVNLPIFRRNRIVTMSWTC
jgi:hypothetical protein